MKILKSTQTSSEIRISWEKRPKDDCDIKEYHVTWYKTNSDKPKLNITTEDTMYSIQNLEACVNYTVEIYAISTDGLKSDIEREPLATDIEGKISLAYFTLFALKLLKLRENC